MKAVNIENLYKLERTTKINEAVVEYKEENEATLQAQKCGVWPPKENHWER